MTLFELVAKISADSSGFEKAVNQADKQGKTLKDSLSNTFDKIGKLAIAAFSGAAIKKGIDTMINLANETAAAGDRIDKQSQVLGLSRKAYQEWDYILSQNGASIDSMSTSMKTMNNLILNAAAGSEEAKDTFAELGLGIHEIENLSPEKQFEAIIRAFQKMPAGAEKSALAVKIFGKAGMDLLPLLNSSSDSIDELRQNAEDLGFMMSDEAIDASVAYGDAMDDLKRTFGGIKNAIVANFLPKFTNAMKGITSYAGKLKKAYDKKGFAGVWETLVEDFKKIKWPTASEILSSLQKVWDGVREGAKNLLKLVFGSTPDGGINWPDPKEVWAKASGFITKIWDEVKKGAATILKLVFGETADGGIDWPEPEEIGRKVAEGLTNMWNGVKNAAKAIMTLIFGDGEGEPISFDATAIWGKISGAFQTFWNGIKGFARGILKFAFGEDENGGIVWPKARDIWEKVKPGLQDLWRGIKISAHAILKFIFGEDPDGGIEWPTPEQVWAKIKQDFIDLWNGIKKSASAIMTFLFGDTVGGGIEWPSAQKLWGQIKGNFARLWGDVKDSLKTAATWLLGLPKLPTLAEIRGAIVKWWQDVWTNFKLTFNVGLGKVTDDTGLFQGGESSGLGWGESLEVHEPGEYGYAKGSRFIPYDHVAMLHRGEEVLTASQARQRREGGNVDLSQVASAVASAVQTGMSDASVNSYLDGKRVTGSVNRRTMTQLRARRFAVS